MSWQKVVSCIGATALVVLVSLSAVLMINGHLSEKEASFGDFELQQDRGVNSEKQLAQLWNFPRLAAADSAAIPIRHTADISINCKNGRCSRSVESDLAAVMDTEESSGGNNEEEDVEVVPLMMYNWNLPTAPRPNLTASEEESIQSVFVYDNSSQVIRLVKFDVAEAHKLDTEAACKNLPLKARAQINVCKNYPTAMPAIVYGVQAAVNQTTIDLRQRRWDGSSLKDPKVGQNLLKRSSRETAYSHAVISAGVAYFVTKSCTLGNIRQCHCDHSVKGGPWDGCSADVTFGAKISAHLLDGAETSQSFASEINRHNNNVGRRAVENSRENECVCHGTSGACTVMTCFKKLPNFSKITKTLVDAYDRSVQVASNHISNPHHHRSRLFVQSRRKEEAGIDELVYSVRSPNFCSKSVEEGSLGTRGRVCEIGQGTGSCLALCCGRGSKVKQKVTYRQCYCSFQFCCNIRCKTCREQTTYHVCR